MAGFAETANLAVKITLDDRAFTGPLGRDSSEVSAASTRALAGLGRASGSSGPGLPEWAISRRVSRRVASLP